MLQYYKLYKLYAHVKHFYKSTVGAKQYMYNVKNTTPTTPLVDTLPQSYALKNHTKQTHMQGGYNNKYIQLSSIHQLHTGSVTKLTTG